MSHLHHEDIEVAGKVDVVGRNLPIGTLQVDTGRPSTGLEVGEKGRCTYHQQDEMLLRGRPVERISRVVRWLRHQHSLDQPRQSALWKMNDGDGVHKY